MTGYYADQLLEMVKRIARELARLNDNIEKMMREEKDG